MSEILRSVNPVDQANGIKSIIPGDLTNALGILWDVNNDTFQYTSRSPPTSAPVTRRSMLSFISSLYDPVVGYHLLFYRVNYCSKKAQG